jgi:hypothetical protein
MMAELYTPTTVPDIRTGQRRVPQVGAAELHHAATTVPDSHAGQRVALGTTSPEAPEKDLVVLRPGG